jgi:hypothetical protein
MMVWFNVAFGFGSGGCGIGIAASPPRVRISRYLYITRLYIRQGDNYRASFIDKSRWVWYSRR